MTLHLIRLTVDLPMLARAAGERGWTAGRRGGSFDEGAALHHLLSETFGKGMLQPFRLLVAPRSTQGRLYAYAQTEPAVLADVATVTASPEIEAALTLSRIEGKPMPGAWQVGQRIGIDIRSRPVIRTFAAIPGTATERPIRKGAEVDAFLAEALRHKDPGGMGKAGRMREVVYTEWLRDRLAGAATLEEARLTAFRRSRVRRNGRSVEGPDAILHGTVRVDDSEAFATLLARGAGRHRAYGYGMMMLRPPTALVPDR